MSAWLAAGTFRLALRAQDGGDYWRARGLYSRVLEIDPDHTPALHNLAVAELRFRRYARSLELTERVLSKPELDEQMSGDKWPELAYSLLYNRALAQTLRATVHATTIDPDKAGSAVEPCRKLVKQVLRRRVLHDCGPARTRLRNLWPRGAAPVDEDELLMLRKIELPAITLLADIILRSANKPEIWEAAARATLATPTSTRLGREQLLGGLGASPTPAWAFAADHYARSQSMTSARAHYNLACYRGRILEALNINEQDPNLRKRVLFNAIEDLANALVDESMIAWATQDPALGSIRAYGGWDGFLRFQRREALDVEAS